MAGKGYLNRSRTKTQARRLRRNLSGRFESKPRLLAAGVVTHSLVQVAGALAPAEGLEDVRGTVLVKNVGRPAATQYTTEAAGTSVINLAGGASGGGGGGGMEEHALDGVYHTGTLPWTSVNKTGSSLADLAARAHSSLTGIGASDHHAPVTAGDTSIDVTGQAIKVALAALSGLTVDDGLLVNAGEGLGIDHISGKLLVDRAVDSGLTWGMGNYSLYALALGEPATLDVDSINSVVGETHSHAVTSSYNPTGWPETVGASLLATNDAGLLQLKELASNAPFFSGFAGSGYRLDYGITEAGKASAEFDNLTVRGRMRVYELLIQQIRATNGSLFVSSSSKAETVIDASDWEYETGGDTVRAELETGGATVLAEFDTLFYTIDTRNEDADDDERHQYHGFLEGDAIRAQRVEWDGSGGFTGVKQVNLVVTTVVDLWRYIAVPVAGSDAPEPGDEFVRLGSTDATRRGSIYLTSDDSNAPYIDVVDGVTTHADWNTPGKVKVRLGKLSGITDSAFGGALSGYGLYADNVYLKGKIVITGGSGYASLTDKPTSLAAINAGEGSKLGGIETGATVGATWGTNLSSIPAHLSTPSTTGLYLTADYVGYWQSGSPGSFKAYLDKNGNFQLGDISSGAGLAWNQAGGTLMIRGGAAIVGGQPIGTPAVGGLYLGSDKMGYYHQTLGWTAYIDSLGSFWAGSSGPNQPYILWNAQLGTLTIRGTLTATAGSNTLLTGGAAADVNANTTTINGGKITTGTITATQIAAGTITATEIASDAITAVKISTGAVTASKIAVDDNISFANYGAIYSGKKSYASTSVGWWIGNDAKDSQKPKFHFGDSNYYIRWTGSDLEINRPNLKGSWVTVGSGGLSYGTGWGTYGYSNDLRYVRVGDFVWVMGWVRANNTSNNAIIATGLPAPAQSFYTGVRSSRPPTPYESSQPNSSGDVVYVEDNSGSGRLVFFGYLSLPGNSYNIDLILNFVYKAA